MYIYPDGVSACCRVPVKLPAMQGCKRELYGFKLHHFLPIHVIDKTTRLGIPKPGPERGL
jgi:hypothetical protein